MTGSGGLKDSGGWDLNFEEEGSGVGDGDSVSESGELVDSSALSSSSSDGLALQAPAIRPSPSSWGL